jgi:polyisoprenoid-binding protein YceI
MMRLTAVAALLALPTAPVLPQAGPAPAGASVRLVAAPTGNEARFKVREQLAELPLPNDAVGVTQAITGAIVLDEHGRVVPAESKFTVDLATLKSDRERRDGYIKRRTLETDKFPTAILEPTGAHGLPAPLPDSGTMTFELLGNLTIHGVTRPSTWRVTATAGHGEFTGTASTRIKFEDFGMTQPRVAIVLSVQDDIGLEYDFHLVPDSAGR